jgi:hypothetical protein
VKVSMVVWVVKPCSLVCVTFLPEDDNAEDYVTPQPRKPHSIATLGLR